METECCDVDAVEDCELLLLTMAALNCSCCEQPGVVDNGGGGVGVAPTLAPLPAPCCICCCCAAAAAAAPACDFALLTADFLLALTGGGPGISGSGAISERKKAVK